MNDNHFQIAIVPANYTDQLQPLDDSVNTAVKEFFGRKFKQWNSDEARKQIEKACGINEHSMVDGFNWITWKPNPSIIFKGFTDNNIFQNSNINEIIYSKDMVGFSVELTIVKLSLSRSIVC